jgi:hypothetical protein
MTSQIKITQLSDIGNNIANTTLVPVVNMTGVSTTQKATIGNIANSILAGAGTTYKNAALANLAYSVANAAQPNITSVGNLTSLTVNGTAYLGNISSTGDTNVTALYVGAIADLGDVANVTIGGGTDGYVLQTDGAGNLSWVAQSGGGNANTGNVTFNDVNIIGDGNLYLQPDPNNNGAYLDIYLTGGPDVHIAGNGETVILGSDAGANVSVQASGNVAIQANAVFGGNSHTWMFDYNGNTTFPDGTVIDSSGIYYPTNNGWNLYRPDNLVWIGSGTNVAYIDTYSPNVSVRIRTLGDPEEGPGYDWIFDPTGNLTLPGNTFAVNYANGQQVQLGGGSTYGNSNVATFLGSYGSNTISTTGNVKTGLLIAPASDNGSIIFSTNGTDNNGSLKVDAGLNMTINANSNFYVKQNGSDRLGITNTNTDLMAASNVIIHANKAGSEQNWIFDTTGNLRTPGNVDIYGAINFPQQVSSINWSTYNIELSQYGRINTNVDFFANANVIGAQYLKGDGSNISNISVPKIANGTSNVNIPTSDSNVVITANGTANWTFGTDGNLTFPNGDLTIFSQGGLNSIQAVDGKSVGLVSSGSTGGIATVWAEDIGNIGSSNIAAVYANPTPGSGIVRIAVGQNGSGPYLWDFNANGTLTIPYGLIGSGASPAPYISGFDSISSISVSASGNANIGGNLILSNTTQIVSTPGSNGNITLDPDGTGVVNVIGNVVANNFSGNISITGNINGTSPNVTLVAGTYNYIFDNTGNFTMPANSDIIMSGESSNILVGGAVNAALHTSYTSSWTLVTGTNTVSISVPLNGVYSIWVRGNIPNGIVTYTATVVVSNPNTPVVGSSYGWYYAAGNALVLTAIPTQIVGTVNSISNDVVSTTTANVFTFGITNNSGTSQVVSYGYTRLG